MLNSIHEPFGVEDYKNLLSADGVDLILRDRNLENAVTLQRLMETDPPSPKDKFWFGLHGESDVGLSGLALCIADRPQMPLCELVARYADMRRTSYTATAIAVVNLYKTRGITYFLPNKWGGEKEEVPWHPFIPPAQPPAKRKKGKK